MKYIQTGFALSLLLLVPLAVSAQLASSSGCVSISHTLRFGSTDAQTKGDVSVLQRALGVQPTGYFGAITQSAVQKWQAAHSIISSGSPNTTGFGVVGPKTRSALAVCSQSTGFVPPAGAFIVPGSQTQVSPSTAATPPTLSVQVSSTSIAQTRTEQLSWQSSQVQNTAVRLSLYSSGGEYQGDIAVALSPNGSYNWTIPDRLACANGTYAPDGCMPTDAPTQAVTWLNPGAYEVVASLYTPPTADTGFNHLEFRSPQMVPTYLAYATSTVFSIMASSSGSAANASASPPASNANSNTPAASSVAKAASPAAVSQPNQKLAAITTQDAFWTYLYTCILDRSPEESIVSVWESANVPSLKAAYQAFFRSPEYQLKQTSDSLFVTQAYECMLFREPEPAGLGYWLGSLQAGLSRDNMVADFVDSPEFQQLIAPTLQNVSRLPSGATSTFNPGLTATPISGAAPLTVTFSYSNLSGASTIDYGDGATASMAPSACTASASGSTCAPSTTQHTYQTTGTYQVTVKQQIGGTVCPAVRYDTSNPLSFIQSCQKVPEQTVLLGNLTIGVHS